MALVVVFVWGLGVALLLSAWNVFFRDTQNVVDVLQTLITWTVPMIYPFVIVAEKLQQSHQLIYQAYLANPLCIAVLLDNRAFWTTASSNPKLAASQELPPHLFERGAITIVVGLMFLCLTQLVFTRLEARFAEKL
jgi:ABC-2 type transport system permease protein